MCFEILATKTVTNMVRKQTCILFSCSKQIWQPSCLIMDPVVVEQPKPGGPAYERTGNPCVDCCKGCGECCLFSCSVWLVMHFAAVAAIVVHVVKSIRFTFYQFL
ncbi:hypothetical protein M3Y98_00814800 [Aphelenchoides besseyi]|nr:hypothetical protein M3Y98_00814800 [Aphelenchoides besseyi]